MKLRHFLFFAGAGLAIGLSSCVSEAELARREAELARREAERAKAIEQAKQKRQALEAERARKAAEAERERKAAEAERARKAAEAEREREEAERKQAWIELVIKEGEQAANYLRKYVSGHSELSEDKRNQGNALLEAFAAEYLPNYSARYKAARLAALEKQEGYCDLLDALQREKVNLSQDKIFQNFLGQYCDAAWEYFGLRNRLIDLYAQHKIGLLSSDDLASVDGKFATSSRK